MDVTYCRGVSHIVEEGGQEFVVGDAAPHVLIELTEDVVEILVADRDVTARQSPPEVGHPQMPLPVDV